MRLSLLCLGFLVALSGLAQTNDRDNFSLSPLNDRLRIEQQMINMMWRNGSWFASPKIGLQKFGYDSNVFSQEVNELDDIYVTPQLALDSFLRINKSWAWRNRLSYGYDYYNDVDELRSSNYNVESRLYYMTGRFFLDLGGEYRQSRRLLNSELELRDRNENIDYDAQFALEFNPRNVLRGSIANTSVDFTNFTTNDQTAAALDRDSDIYGLTYYYRINRSKRLFFGGETATHDFTSAGNFRDDSEFTSLFIGLRSEENERYNYLAQIGSTSIDLPFAGNAEGDFATGQIIANYNISRLSRFQFGAARRVIFSQYQTSPFFLSNRVELSYRHELRRDLIIMPTVRFGTNDYEEALPTTIDREDDILEISAVVEFPMPTNYSLNLSLSYLERDSNVPLQSDEGFRVGGSFFFGR